MRYSISDTAEYGDLTRGPAHHHRRDQGRDAARSSTRSSQRRVRRGVGRPRCEAGASQLQRAASAGRGAPDRDRSARELRAMMPWISAGKTRGRRGLGRRATDRADAPRIRLVGLLRAPSSARRAESDLSVGLALAGMTDERLGLRDPPDPRRPGAGPDHRGPGRADLPDDVVPVPRHGSTPPNLFALAEIGNIYTRIMNPTQARVRGPDRRARRRDRDRGRHPGRAGRGVGPGGRDARHPQPGRGRRATSCRRPSLYGGTYNLFHYTLPKLGIEVDVHRRPRRPRRVAGRDPPEHQGVLRRDASATRRTTSSTSRASPTCPRARRAADRRQHGADAVPDPAVRVGRRHRRALGHQVHRRPRHVDRRRASSTAARSTSRASGQFPQFTEPDPSYHGLAVLAGARARARTSSRPACSCCATSARRSRRSTRSCSCRASRR